METTSSKILIYEKVSTFLVAALGFLMPVFLNKLLNKKTTDMVQPFDFDSELEDQTPEDQVPDDQQPELDENDIRSEYKDAIQLRDGSWGVQRQGKMYRIK